MSKRQLILDTIHNKPTDRVPVGFWFHFGGELSDVLKEPEQIQHNVEGHKKFVKEFQPDFVKLMSDGFFYYPNPIITHAKHASELKTLKPLGESHPWITKQTELVKELTDSFGADLFTFYNIFGPATSFKFLLDEDSDKTLADFILQDKEAVKHALDVIAEDLAILAKKVITKGKADGIYLSVQNVQDERISPELYKEVIAPSEIKVLESANEAGGINILHICGYEGSRNDLHLYLDYDAQLINWAVNIENVSLEEGKKLFGGKTVIGGFDNRPNSLLHKGSKEDIEKFTEQLLLGAGKTGIILGADCTVPSDIEFERLEWVRNKAVSL